MEENRIEGNTVGAFIENSNGNVFVGNTVAANYIGLRLSDSSFDNQFAMNRLGGNIHAVETTGTNASNRWTIEGVGNYWKDALKLDLDRNEIVDVPHRETDLFGPWRRTFPEIGLLSGSPGERAVRFVHSRIHLPGIAGVTDDRPLTRVPLR
jgi:nitrous oxidase accessory protein